MKYKRLQTANAALNRENTARGTTTPDSDCIAELE